MKDLSDKLGELELLSLGSHQMRSPLVAARSLLRTLLRIMDGGIATWPYEKIA